MTQPQPFPADLGSGVLFTNTSLIDDAINIARKNSIHYLLFGLACCGIELMQTGGPRADLDRFASVFRASPRQADLMIVAGTLTYKMAVRTKLLYDQMAEPKYVLSMGSCANCGGLFQMSYSVCKGVDKIIPVDVYVPGCPPRPEALTEGLMRIQDIMMCERWKTRMRPGRVDPDAPMMIQRVGSSPALPATDHRGRAGEPFQGSPDNNRVGSSPALPATDHRGRAGEPFHGSPDNKGTGR